MTSPVFRNAAVAGGVIVGAVTVTVGARRLTATPLKVLAALASVALLPAASLMELPLILMALAPSAMLLAASSATIVYSKVSVVEPEPTV